MLCYAIYLIYLIYLPIWGHGVLVGNDPLWCDPLLQLYLFCLVSHRHLVNLGSAAGALDEGFDSALFGPSAHAIGAEVVVASGLDYVCGLEFIKAYPARDWLFLLDRHISAGDYGL